LPLPLWKNIFSGRQNPNEE
jgi:hypothetical protein